MRSSWNLIETVGTAATACVAFLLYVIVSTCGFLFLFCEEKKKGRMDSMNLCMWLIQIWTIQLRTEKNLP